MPWKILNATRVEQITRIKTDFSVIKTIQLFYYAKKSVYDGIVKGLKTGHDTRSAFTWHT